MRNTTIVLPASVGIAVLLACVVALLAALAVAPRASVASHGDEAWFLVRCDFSHRASVDPIVFPYPEKSNPPDNQNDAHSHDFLGNKTTNYNSTYDGKDENGREIERAESMIGQPTTCSRPEDTAGYWFPTVSWNGDELKPNRVNFYYRAGGKDHATVEPFPAKLKVITDRATWYCGIDDSKAGTQDPPRNCKSGVLGLRIVFPDCSNGQPDSADHRSHMARSVLQTDGTRTCPETHPNPVPRITLNANFPLPKPSGTVTLSSGAASTMHADFWNTWDQAAQVGLVKKCINDVVAEEPHPLECRAPTGTA